MKLLKIHNDILKKKTGNENVRNREKSLVEQNVFMIQMLKKKIKSSV